MKQPDVSEDSTSPLKSPNENETEHKQRSKNQGKELQMSVKRMQILFFFFKLFGFTTRSIKKETGKGFKTTNGLHGCSSGLDEQ